MKMKGMVEYCNDKHGAIALQCLLLIKKYSISGKQTTLWELQLGQNGVVTLDKSHTFDNPL